MPELRSLMNRQREVYPEEESAASTLPALGFPYKSRAESTSMLCLQNKSDTSRAYFHVIKNVYDDCCIVFEIDCEIDGGLQLLYVALEFPHEANPL
ncbi:hypothetical protein AVEN_222772-1 [Araneus ventricosus]|uniref:Uncharacterized protein n=1 Tax=Araneus ventricosus TaxID=182803 RepID=A0A4Y2AYZ0_ARAVE|nr:hypothetical protein AVEN_222772-1 [Araneus ventricosus]